MFSQYSAINFNDNSGVAFVLFCLFAIFVIGAYLRYGKVFDLFMPSDEDVKNNRISTVYMREMFYDLVNFKNKTVSRFDEELNKPFVFIHEAFDVQCFELEFKSVHKSIMSNVMEFWIANKDANVQMSKTFVVNTFYKDAMEELSLVPNMQKFQQQVFAAVAHVVNQYDFPESSDDFVLMTA